MNGGKNYGIFLFLFEKGNRTNPGSHYSKTAKHGPQPEENEKYKERVNTSTFSYMLPSSRFINVSQVKSKCSTMRHKVQTAS